MVCKLAANGTENGLSFLMIQIIHCGLVLEISSVIHEVFVPVECWFGSIHVSAKIHFVVTYLRCISTHIIIIHFPMNNILSMQVIEIFQSWFYIE